MVKRKTHKNKKKRHIITRKNKRKRRRKTKKRKAGTKGKAPPRVNKRVFELRHKSKTDAFTKKRRSALKRPSKLRIMTKRAKEKKRVTFQPIQNEEGKNDNANDMAVNTELTELFSNLTPPSYASREHNSAKTLASPPPNK